jgi:hypothetical protein
LIRQMGGEHVSRVEGGNVRVPDDDYD